MRTFGLSFKWTAVLVTAFAVITLFQNCAAPENPKKDSAAVNSSTSPDPGGPVVDPNYHPVNPAVDTGTGTGVTVTPTAGDICVVKNLDAVTILASSNNVDAMGCDSLCRSNAASYPNRTCLFNNQDITPVANCVIKAYDGSAAGKPVVSGTSSRGACVNKCADYPTITYRSCQWSTNEVAQSGTCVIVDGKTSLHNAASIAYTCHSLCDSYTKAKTHPKRTCVWNYSAAGVAKSLKIK